MYLNAFFKIVIALIIKYKSVEVFSTDYSDTFFQVFCPPLISKYPKLIRYVESLMTHCRVSHLLELVNLYACFGRHL